jgi:hypothetical protein
MRDDSLVSTDLAALSAAYWRHHQLSQGTRQERLASEEYFWAWDAVETATWESPEESLEMIDAILHHPDADPVLVGAGPIEDLLSDPPQLVEEIARRCRTDALWREAVGSAIIDDPIPDSLSPYAMRPLAGPPRKPAPQAARRRSRTPRPARKPRGLRGK